MAKRGRDAKLSNTSGKSWGKTPPWMFRTLADGSPGMTAEALARLLVRLAVVDKERWAVEIVCDYRAQADQGDRSAEERIEDVTVRHLNDLAGDDGAGSGDDGERGSCRRWPANGQVTGTNPAPVEPAAPQHGPYWTCPRTGITIPKTLEANLRWRQRLLDEAQMSDTMQAQLRAACAASPWFWLNGFGYTFRQKRVNDTGEEVPTSGTRRTTRSSPGRFRTNSSGSFARCYRRRPRHPH
jgi:hypothetical protein